jgi:FKBP-type peptidyl-prolyl cis-trans isomerase
MDEGILTMSLGEKSVLHITFGYGSRGAGRTIIPPNSDLNFEVELIEIQR